ncbi:MAG: phosphate starvation-inducible protein PhoH, partial [Clostridia bacterium]|nr:phosphate starvation-inducible protein PhoH [Clostridia bacterium]
MINIDRLDYAVNLFGSFDENIKILEKELGVSMILRGSELKIWGDEEKVAYATSAVSALLDLAANGETLNDQNIRYAISLSEEGNADKLSKLGGDCICITAKGKPIKPKTLGQQKYVESIRKNTI